VADLERHGHLDLSQENRSQLLSMSARTAERLLRTYRKSAPRGLSTTQAGPLLKQQIPIRTFHGWDETQPGFLEADLVAHCGEGTRGSYLYTLTLTDVATGWTECLPVLYKSAEAVLSAFQQARGLFPFPILGLDTDSGGEFINASLKNYCEAEQITFTRGREGFKPDQCYVEQKNGAIVRQFVGFDRLVGEQAYWQLREVYRAVRLFVNCFQPSMKLVSKERDAEQEHRVYDPAKTPWQRLVLSGVLPTASQQSLSEVVQALDPLEVLHQLERLQQALRRCAVHPCPSGQSAAAAPLLRFWVECCLQGVQAFQKRAPTRVSVWQKLQDEPPGRTGLLDWPRTSRNSFEGQWELILSLVLAHPDWSGNDLFQEMLRQFPGRYRPLQQSTLQIGLRKIRARLLTMIQEPWPQEVLQRDVPPVNSGQREQEADRTIEMVPVASAVLPSQEPGGGCPLRSESTAEEEEAVSSSAEYVPSVAQPNGEPSHGEPDLADHSRDASPALAQEQEVQQARLAPLSIERAIQAYLQEHREAGRSPKTLEWHQTALGLFQQYLVGERHLALLCQITQDEVQGWLAFLRMAPSAETGRSAMTVFTYARSARAFCHWAVRKGYLEQTPFVKALMPKAEQKVLHLIEPDEFERLLLACHAGEESDVSAERAAVRNRAILWVFLDTGMRVSELCGLRLSDVDREQRALLVLEKGGKERWLTLSPNAWYQLLSFLERYRPKEVLVEEGRAQEDHLFLSEWYRPLKANSITLLFDRLKKRAGISDKPVSPTVLRDTSAVRYLQAGGQPEALLERLGLHRPDSITHYQRYSKQLREEQKCKETLAEPLP
jgi:site-specific recombinase XerD